MKSYDCCFIGNETVDWLCKCGHVPNRQMGVAVMNVLLDNRIVSAGIRQSKISTVNCNIVYIL